MMIAEAARYRLDSEGDFPFPHHLRIDNASLSPERVATMIAEHFDLAGTRPAP